MRKKVPLLILFFSFQLLHAQKNIADSFLHVLQSQKIDSLQNIVLLTWMDNSNSNSSIYDSATYYSNRIIETGEMQHNSDVKAIGQALLGYYFASHDNPPQALEHFLKAMQLGEKRNNMRVMARLYHFASFYGDARRSIEYEQKVIALSKQTGELNWQTVATMQIGTLYRTKLQQYDSALIYLQQAYELNLRMNRMGKRESYFDVAIPVALGNTFMKLNNPTLALAYYKLGMQAAVAHNAEFYRVYKALANYYKEMNDHDSSFYYANKLYQFSQQASATFKASNTAVAANLLYQIYKERGRLDSALKYHEIFQAANDTINNMTQAQKLESLLSAENERQKELSEKKKQEEGERKHNLQYAAIAIAIITLLIIFFTLSRSIIVKEKFIEFFGVLALLAVFEFINLFIHPYLAHATNDSPVLMLLILIGIGALLVPLHHRLEKWITKQMVDKNKKIRLVAAKKTIAKLEAE